MNALGLLPELGRAASQFALPPDSGKGLKVLGDRIQYRRRNFVDSGRADPYGLVSQREDEQRVRRDSFGLRIAEAAGVQRASQMEAKIDASQAAVERLFPWEKIPFSQGAWIGQLGGVYFRGPYRAFTEPDDRIYFAGDFCSHVLVWQEGRGCFGAVHRINARRACPRG